MTARALWVLAVLSVLGAFVGCSSTPTGQGNLPSWVTRGRPDNADRDTLYAVGMSTSDPNERMMLTKARQDARTELSKQVMSYVVSLVKDFMQSHRDFADPKSSSSIAFTRAVSKSVSEALLEKSEQIDSFKDPASGNLYVLYQMPASMIRKNAEARARAVAENRGLNPFTETEKALDAMGREFGKQYGVRPEEPKKAPVVETPAKPAESGGGSKPVARGPSELPSGDAPDWIRTQSSPKYPIGEYMLGVGMGDDLTQASKSAKTEIAGQIQEDVNQNFKEQIARTRTEKKYLSSETVVVDTMTRVSQTLISSRVVETWYDRGKQHMYVLAVLDRKKAAAQLVEEGNEQLRAARKGLERMDENLRAGRVINALSDLEKALIAVSEVENRRLKIRVIQSDYLSQVQAVPADMTVDGLWNKIQSIVQALELQKTGGDRQETRPGIGLKDELKVTVFYTGGGRRVAVGGVNLDFAFDKGKGTLQSPVMTNSSGVAECKVARVEHSGLEVNSIKVTVNEKSLGVRGLNLSMPKPVVFTYTLPTQKTSQIAVYIIEQDLNGNVIKRSIVQDKIMDALGQEKFRVVEETQVLGDARRAGLGKNATDAEIIKALAARNVTFIIFGHVTKSVRQEERRPEGTWWTFVEARGSIRLIDVFAGKVVATITPSALGTLNTADKQQAKDGAADRGAEALAKDAARKIIPVVKKYFQ